MGAVMNLNPSSPFPPIVCLDPVLETFGYSDVKRITSRPEDINKIHLRDNSTVNFAKRSLFIRALRLASLAQDGSIKSITHSKVDSDCYAKRSGERAT